MKNWKTTLIGCLMAALLAAKPYLDGTGYHLDNKTIAEISFAVLTAIGGVLAKDFSVSGTTQMIILFAVVMFSPGCSLPKVLGKDCKVTGVVFTGTTQQVCLRCDSLSNDAVNYLDTTFHVKFLKPINTVK